MNLYLKKRRLLKACKYSRSLLLLIFCVLLICCNNNLKKEKQYRSEDEYYLHVDVKLIEDLNSLSNLTYLKSNVNLIDQIKSGYFEVWDISNIFRFKKLSDTIPSLYSYYAKVSNNVLKIYNVRKEEPFDINNCVGEEYSCDYFDGRYTILTDWYYENARSILIDLKFNLYLALDYEFQNKLNMTRIVLMNDALQERVSIREAENTLTFDDISEYPKIKRLDMDTSILTQKKKTLLDLDYLDLKIINESLMSILY